MKQGFALAHGPDAHHIQWHQKEQHHAVVSLYLSPSLEVFQGHFPNSPILPGVAQLDWVLTLGQHTFNLPAYFHSLQALKFVRPITPEMTIQIELEQHRKETEDVLHFRISSRNALAEIIEHASGRAQWSHIDRSAQE
ncbi:hypothetical protein E9531_07860 [Lampropedia puyangensis]|uniref:ApeI dehydratase-like domain-containing protein n=1 Tax=Lampropedia puyangensis TaxID=1330072 RepID=A0A4S8F646_9BURK|nr:hypothetical protein [Lampropedia puyangensis]THU02579.1 hypothetical protein E9531_07860 [Lampropedia puyangensis]